MNSIQAVSDVLDFRNMDTDSSSDSANDGRASASVADSQDSMCDESPDSVLNDDEIIEKFDLAAHYDILPITAFFPVLQPDRPGCTRDTKITNYFGHLRRSSSRSLFDLPAETRIHIYEYCLPRSFTTRDQGIAAKDNRNTCHRAAHEVCLLEEHRSHSPAELSRGYTALLLTCKAIYKEAVDVLYSPRRSHVSPTFTRVRLSISSREVRLRGYNMFCPKHLTYREGIGPTFSRMRYFQLEIKAKDHGTIGYSGSYSPKKLSSWANTRENIQWVANQLRQAASLEKLVLNIDFLTFVSLMDLEEAREVLEHFSVLRNIPHTELYVLGNKGGLTEAELSKFSAYKHRWQALLAGNDLVVERSVSVRSWNLLKRFLVQFAVDHGNYDVADTAHIFYHAQDRKAIQRLVVDMYSTCVADADLWEKYGEGLINAVYGGLLFHEDRSNSRGPLR